MHSLVLQEHCKRGHSCSRMRIIHFLVLLSSKCQGQSNSNYSNVSFKVLILKLTLPFLKWGATTQPFDAWPMSSVTQACMYSRVIKSVVVCLVLLCACVCVMCVYLVQGEKMQFFLREQFQTCSKPKLYLRRVLHREKNVVRASTNRDDPVSDIHNLRTVLKVDSIPLWLLYNTSFLSHRNACMDVRVWFQHLWPQNYRSAWQACVRLFWR